MCLLYGAGMVIVVFNENFHSPPLFVPAAERRVKRPASKVADIFLFPIREDSYNAHNEQYADNHDLNAHLVSNIAPPMTKNTRTKLMARLTKRTAPLVIICLYLHQNRRVVGTKMPVMQNVARFKMQPARVNAEMVKPHTLIFGASLIHV